jgi:hypothetical protein
LTSRADAGWRDGGTRLATGETLLILPKIVDVLATLRHITLHTPHASSSAFILPAINFILLFHYSIAAVDICTPDQQRNHVDSIADPAGRSAQHNFECACASHIVVSRQRTHSCAICGYLVPVADTCPGAFCAQLCHSLQVRALQRTQHPAKHCLARLPRRAISYQCALCCSTVREARLEIRSRQDVPQQDQRPYQVPA